MITGRGPSPTPHSFQPQGCPGLVRLPEGCPRLQSQGVPALSGLCLRVSCLEYCPPTHSSNGWHQHGEMVTSRGSLLSGPTPIAKGLDWWCQLRAPHWCSCHVIFRIEDQTPCRAQKRPSSSVPPCQSLESAKPLKPQVNPWILSLPTAKDLWAR